MPVFASWRKRFSDHLAARPSLKKARVQKIFSSLQLNCFGARHRYNIQELKKAQPEFCSLEKLGGEGSFGLICCLDRIDGTEERRPGERDMDIKGKVTVEMGAGLVISWVSY